MLVNVNKANELSPRETEVAGLIAWGFTDKEVAMQLQISHYTVRVHHANINQKTGSRNGADLARWYFETVNEVELGHPPVANFKRVITCCVFILLIGVAEVNQNCVFRTGKPVAVRVIRGQRSNFGKDGKTLKLT